MSEDERYVLVKDLKQGEKFEYEGDQYMRLPDHCECYGHEANSVNLKTGTMINFTNIYVDLLTKIGVKNI